MWSACRNSKRTVVERGGIVGQAEYPGVKCFAYAPPGATLSLPMAREVSSFVTSVVVGKDMVPRVSLPTVHALLGDVVGRRGWWRGGGGGSFMISPFP